MLNSLTTKLPGMEMQGEDGAWDYLVTIKYPVFPPHLNPPQESFLVTLVLMELLRLKLAETGVTKVFGCGPLSLIRINLTVIKPEKFLELICEALASVDLLEFTTIYALDEREILWRSVYPQKGLVVLFSDLKNEADRSIAETQRNMAAAKEFLRSLGYEGEPGK